MKRLYLTAIVKEPNEKGQEIIDNAIKPKEGGLSKQWYIEQNLTPPSDIDDTPEIDENGLIFLEEQYLQTINLDVTIPLKNIDSYASAQEGGSIIYTKANVFYHVAEEVDEIDFYIDFISRSWFQKIKDYINYQIDKIKEE